MHRGGAAIGPEKKRAGGEGSMEVGCVSLCPLFFSLCCVLPPPSRPRPPARPSAAMEAVVPVAPLDLRASDFHDLKKIGSGK